METLYEVSPGLRASTVPRCYQIRDHDETFRLWDSGVIGVLTRAATGTGKTYMGCNKIDTWLRRGTDYRAMIVCHEVQLVWQFAQEVEDFIGIRPGIEMGAQSIDANDVPRVVVASRATVIPKSPPTPEQVAAFAQYGIFDLGAIHKGTATALLRYLKAGGDVETARDDIGYQNTQPEACGNIWSRLHKFDWKLNWMLLFDEAHRHAYHLDAVRPIVDWFERNTKSRRNGITATPKRGDGISLGDKMFPGIALDYPLSSPTKSCAVRDGYAVPYVQKYIEVEGVDFASLSKIGGDFDEAELEKTLGEEKMLATLCVPLLDLVGDRRTLIFSPGVEMAKNVARFINARVETKCTCGKIKWFPKLLVGDGATCECGSMLSPESITKDGEHARQLDGSSPEHSRKETYKDHQAGKFQFLSVCGLCREGYNDPEIACVAVFRPVSGAASSLAEQMKGRACRTLRGIIDGLLTPEERLAAIAASDKPYALIVDLVGITGLADCATTVQIYAEGLADVLKEAGHEDPDEMAAEIVARAEEILLDEGGGDVNEAMATAQRESEESRERAKQERLRAEQAAREEAERRSKAGATVNYSQHDVGHGTQLDPSAATDAQYKYAKFLGMDINVLRSKKQLGRIINQLRQRLSHEEVAATNRLGEGDWVSCGPSMKQLGLMKWKNIPTFNAKSGYDASLLIDSRLDSSAFVAKRKADMDKAKSKEDLDAVGKDIAIVRGVLSNSLFAQLVEHGKACRSKTVVVEEHEEW